MNHTDDRYRALKLEQEGRNLTPQIIDLLRGSKLVDTCYAFKLRTKSEDKLLEKKARKRTEKPDYDLDHVTDVVGLRLVALFRSDMIELLEGCLKAIAHENGVSPNPFRRGNPDEIIFYKGNSAFDDLSISLRQTVEKVCGKDLQIAEKNSREGYSSIHLVARLSSTNLEKEFGTAYYVPVEIQIRTVFEDAWGEIDHKYGYVTRTGKHTGQPIRNPENVLSHLKILKRFTDACMEYGEAIRKEATQLEDTAPVKTAVISVDMDDELIVRLVELNVPTDQVEKYTEARNLKSLALQYLAGTKLYDEKKCAEAAEAFRDIAAGLENEQSNSEWPHGRK